MIFDNPEFFDIFGLIGFIFITWLAIHLLTKKQAPPKWASVILLIIGILGLIIDGAIVFINYLR